VVALIKKRPSLVERLKLCEKAEDFASLYNDALSRFGTSTKNTIVAVDVDNNIAINGEFLIPQESSSIFYVAYADGVPCVLKFPPKPAAAEDEFSVFSSVPSSHPGHKHLVQLQLLRFTSPSHSLPRHVALKMDIFVSTLMSCPQDTRLQALFARAATASFHALCALHSSNYAHCDVKPGNIFINASGECFLGDFDASLRLGKLVGRTTWSFLPDELKALKDSNTLYASPAVDFGMLACTLAFVMKVHETGSLTGTAAAASPLRPCAIASFGNSVAALAAKGDAIRGAHASTAVAAAAAAAAAACSPVSAAAVIAEVMNKCVSVLQADEQVKAGGAILAARRSEQESKRRQQLQQRSSGSPMPAKLAPLGSPTESE
jgi:hypothetical protein